MNNNFPFSNSNKHYHSYDYYLKNKYDSKVFKVALDGGFTCPNRDGSKSTEGCIFCSKQGAGEFAGSRLDDLDTQFQKQIDMLHRKWPIAKYIAYFQAYTNTYAPLPILKTRFEHFINHPDVVGLAIATRPDCLSSEVLDYLAEINQKTDLYVELGLQTIFDQTAIYINRQYPYTTFIKAVEELNKRNIKIVVHLINGLPFETKEMMIQSAKAIGSLTIHGIKIHSLNVLKDTKLAKLYVEGAFKLQSQQEYIETIVEQLRYIKPEIVIQRITGDAKVDDLIAPLWSIKKTIVINEIDKLMNRENIFQGDLYGK